MLKILESILSIISSAVNYLRDKKQQDLGADEARLEDSNNFIKSVQDGKKTSDEISNLSMDELREYNRTGVWPATKSKPDGNSK